MRLFDIFGFIAVAAWVVIVATYAFLIFDSDATGLSLTGGDVDLREETIWMAIYQSGEEVGVMREDRTRLIDGWLIELQGLVEINLMGQTRSLRLDTKTNLATDLGLRSALGRVEAFGRELRIDGRYRPTDELHRFEFSLAIDDARRSFTINLKERPFLLGHAIPRMLSSDDLSVGSRFTQDYFDPLTMTPSSIQTVYEGVEEISQYGQVHQAHRFRQTQQGMETTLFTDDGGSVLRQFMPMDFHMVAVPEFLGSSSFRSANQDFSNSDKDLPPFLRTLDPEILLGLMARTLGASSSELDDELSNQELFPSFEIFGDLDLDDPPSDDVSEQSQ